MGFGTSLRSWESVFPSIFLPHFQSQQPHPWGLTLLLLRSHFLPRLPQSSPTSFLSLTNLFATLCFLASPLHMPFSLPGMAGEWPKPRGSGAEGGRPGPESQGRCLCCGQARLLWATTTDQGAGSLYCPRTLKATTQQSLESPLIILNKKERVDR